MSRRIDYWKESGTTANSEFYEAFVKTYVNEELTETYDRGKLEKYRKEAFIQHTAYIAYDFQILDADKYNILFECKNGIKWILADTNMSQKTWNV